MSLPFTVQRCLDAALKSIIGATLANTDENEATPEDADDSDERFAAKGWNGFPAKATLRGLGLWHP